MAFYDWDEKLSVKIDEIDRQHKQLISLINRLYDAIKERRASDELGDILRELADYTVTHFSYEEQYMEKNGYPELASHLPLHTVFVEKMRQFVTDQENGKLFLSTEILDFLKDWLNNHIMVTDQKYSQYFIEQGLLTV